MRRKLLRKKTDSNHGKHSFSEKATLLVGLSSIVLSALIGVNQININNYNKKESEAAKNLINYAQFDNEKEQMQIIPYSSEYYNLRSFLHYAFDGTIKKKLFDQPTNTTLTHDIIQNIRQFINKHVNLELLDGNIAIFDGYPIILENYYVYKGRNYHTRCMYYLLFTVKGQIEDVNQNVEFDIELKNILYIKSLNSIKSIEEYLLNEEKIYTQFINNSRLGKL